MEVTALSVGKSVLNGALGYAKSAFAEEVALQLGIQKDHAFVTDELEIMRSFMMEAHEERDNSKVVKTWVKQVRDTAYDVEDSLLDFSVRFKNPPWWRFPRTLLDRHRVAKQMKELRAKVEVVSQRNVRYHLIKGSGSKATTTTAEKSSAIAEAIFGVDDARYASKQMKQRVDLVQLISTDDEDPKVIAVWGRSGDVGVASTIMEAYENQDVQGKFSGRAWVRLTHPFRPRSFVQSLVNEFQAAEGVEALIEIKKAKQDLAKKFNEYVINNRCLIVLNDLSTIEEWNQIKKCFQNIKKGSRIIVSTMQVEVASLCAGQESQASELKRLSHDQTLYAFYKKGSQEESQSLNAVSNREAATARTEDPIQVPEIIEGDQTIGLEESQLIWRRKEIAEIVKLLTSKSSQQVEVISVWGKGGVGKAALFSNVYKSPKLSEKFEKFVFVTIIRPFNLAELLESLVVRLDQGSSTQQLMLDNRTGPKQSLPTISGLIEELKRHLNMKSCLIVLDDVSSISEWDQISPCLIPHLEAASRIIVTTRENDIAKHCSSEKHDNVYNLKVLDPDDDGIQTFHKKGSQEGGYTLNPVPNQEAATFRTDDPAQIPDELQESQLIGRTKEIDYIVKLLTPENSQQVEVISVWGMGGLGKTALVSSVYKSPKLSDKFEKFVFVTVMRPFKLADLLESLVVRLDQESSQKDQLMLNNRTGTQKSLETLFEGLKRHINMKSCLIVLDDVLSISEWDKISPYLHSVQLKETSRVIVTTRTYDIAKHCSSGKHNNIYNLSVLDPDDALHLFRKKVFGKCKVLSEKSHDLIEEEKQILKKCGGLPLAIAAIGGFLASQPKTVDEWRKLNDNIRAVLEMNPELEIIKVVLEKSYDGLPYHLKSCFLYLSIFPEDQTISRRRLVRRWAAEGYSTEAHGRSAIEIADDYFVELKNRSMILPSQQSIYSRKSIDSCKVHDFIGDIAIKKSMEENLVFRLQEGCSMNIHGPIRHLAISSDWKGDDKSEFESIVDLSRIRSLSLFGEWKPFFISDKMRFLRVLDLEGTNDDLKYHHLDQIWKLIHLKYLSLRGCSGIDLLPDSLGNLRQLQTLDIRDTNIEALPKTMSKLRKLQYIHAGFKSDYVWEENVSLVERCLEGACLSATCCLPLLLGIDGPSHKALTRRDACTFSCCVKFPALVAGACDERGAMVPRGVRKLKDLHTLCEVDVGRGNNVLWDIGLLTGLRKLGVSGINKKNGRAFCSAISELSRLESLSVRPSAGESGLCGCMDGISSPPENLQSLKLYGKLEKLPQWIKELQHLVKLKLVGTRLLEHDATMELLGKPPKLEILVLLMDWSSFQCEELDFKSPQGGIAFRSLRVLTLKVAGKIKSFKFAERAMPKLERLQVSVTEFINNEIDISGLGFCPSINEVQVIVLFTLDLARIDAAPDAETRQRILDEEAQEARRKHGELKKKIQEQLAHNTNEPIVTVHGW